MNQLEYWLRDLVLTDQRRNKKQSVFVQTTKSIPKKSMTIIVKHNMSEDKSKTHEERALQIIDNIPDVPLPLRRIPGPLKFIEPAKQIAKWLIKKDPLGLID